MRETNIIPRESWKKKKIFNLSQPGLENIHLNLNDNVTIEIMNMKWHFKSVTFYQISS